MNLTGIGRYEMSDLIAKSYNILDKLRLPNGLYLASVSNHYSYTWIRDSVYCSLPYLNKPCDTYERTFHRLLDLFHEYEWKIDIHTKIKPQYLHEYMHSRYSIDGKEIDEPWGHHQIDAIGIFLWGVAEGIKQGKQILRNNEDREIIHKLVQYLECIEVWESKDNGMWEEHLELHSSSIGSALAALTNIKNIIYVPEDMINKCEESLFNLLPFESETRPVDLSQLSLIYPYNILPKEYAELIINRVEKYLVRDKGVIRYQGDSYYSTLEDKHGRNKPSTFYLNEEAEWCMGFGFLALAYLQLNKLNEANYYIRKLESVALKDGSIPELYYSKTDKYNVNTPLGWSNAMYILAKEVYTRRTQ
jgi:phosphorylase kinase alpha/beta subunit